jgi:SNF2 family DNA or RNA helicase
VLDYTGPEYKRKAKQQTMQRWDVVITTYHTLRNDVDFLETVPFGYVVFDESQNFKNRTSQLYHSVTQLQSEHRLALSGTPIENSLGDLWSLMEVLNPGLLGGFTDFSRLYMQPISEQIEEKRTAALRQIVAPYILRRTKEQVLTDLPERTDELMVCLMDSEQKKVYDEQVSSVRNLIITTGESATHSTAILAGLMRIRQIANHPRLPELTKEGSTLKPADLSINESGKLKAVFCHLENIVSSGHKALIFSDFVNLLEIVSAEFDRRGWKFVQLTGSTQNREDVVNRFQNDADCPFFLISLKAGGVGLNLTAADYVLLLDPWWNTAAEEQAICRAYRMGQQNPVFVYRYVSESTLEERILHLQRNKQTLAEAVLNSHLLDAEPLNE